MRSAHPSTVPTPSCHSREVGKTRPQADVSSDGHPYRLCLHEERWRFEAASPAYAKWSPAFAAMTIRQGEGSA